MAEVQHTSIPKFAVQPEVGIGKKAQSIAPQRYKQAWTKLSTGEGVENFSQPPDNTVHVFSEINMLAKMVHDSFYQHYPLELSPDVMWITIMQGFALHVHQNAEELRGQFVDFDGKKKLTIALPDFVIGSPHNDWTRCFPMFEEEIRKNIGDDTTNLVTQEFSTTNAVDKMTMQIVLMDVVESYFEYDGMCGCGIPSVQLTGTPEDWIAIRERAEKLQKFGLDWWLKDLLPVLDHFVSAAKGHPDFKFFKSLCNKYGLSGFKSPMNGWIQCFFPYILDQGGRYKQNKCLSHWMKHYSRDAPVSFAGWDDNGLGNGIDLDLIPPSISSVPFTLRNVATGESQDYTFCAGVTTVSQDPDSTVRCSTGWAVLKGSGALKAKASRG